MTTGKTLKAMKKKCIFPLPSLQAHTHAHTYTKTSSYPIGS